MKKKCISFLLSVLMVLGLCACGGQSEPVKKTHTIAMICESSIHDGGWGESCYKGMTEAAEKRGWQTMYKDSLPLEQTAAAMEEFCEQGVDMIYATGEQYNGIVLQMSKNYPGTAFTILNGLSSTSMSAVYSNVVSVLPSPQQIGWMAGSLAALQTKTGTLAFIGGVELESTRMKYKSFCDAAEFVAAEQGKSVNVLDLVYAGTFDDASVGSALAEKMMAQGADVFFGDASAVDSGVRTAIDAHNASAGKAEVFDIAQPDELLGANECVIGSVVTDNAAMLAAVMNSYEAGTYGGSTQYGSIQNSTLTAGKLSELVSEEDRTAFADYCQQMLDMTFMNDIHF